MPIKVNIYVCIKGIKCDFASQRGTVVARGEAEVDNFPKGGY
jgi:hypothetical protein